MTTYKVGYIVGSLATASISRTLAKALIRLAPPEPPYAAMLMKVTVTTSDFAVWLVGSGL